MLTLGYSRKAVRLLTFHSSTRIWAELHEQAFRRLGGATRTVVLDNLGEGVLKPDIYDPTLNPLYRDMLTHYGAVALPCRVARSGSKGQGGAQRRPRQEHTAEGPALREPGRGADLPRSLGSSSWADTRIHGTTKRQVAAMFAEEKPALLPLPLEPFRYYQFGERRVNLDGCVEVEAAYYSAPPGWIGRRVKVQWDGHAVRVLDPRTGQLLREHLRQQRGRHRIPDEDQPAHTPRSTSQLLARCDKIGPHIGALAEQMYRRDGRGVDPPHSWACSAWPASTAPRSPTMPAPPRWKSGCLPTRTASSRRYLERRPPTDASPGGSHHPPTHPVPRPHRQQNQGEPRMNLIELQRSLRQLRLGGMAAVLETRLHQAQAEPMAPIDLLSHVWSPTN